jgi:hypothetical protein
MCGEGHVPLAATASPALAAPIEAAADTAADDVAFTTSITRLGHEPRPTAPYTEAVWAALLDGSDRADAALTAAGLTLTAGGEPTFTSREHPTAPELNEAALGASKWAQGLSLVDALAARLTPGAAIVHRLGKQYPDEPLPRWSLDVCARVDGAPLWPARALPADASTAAGARLTAAIATALGLPTAGQPVFEDPWPLLAGEAALPIVAGAAGAPATPPPTAGARARSRSRRAGRLGGAAGAGRRRRLADRHLDHAARRAVPDPRRRAGRAAPAAGQPGPGRAAAAPAGDRRPRSARAGRRGRRRAGGGRAPAGSTPPTRRAGWAVPPPPAAMSPASARCGRAARGALWVFLPPIALRRLARALSGIDRARRRRRPVRLGATRRRATRRWCGSR